MGQKARPPFLTTLVTYCKKCGQTVNVAQAKTESGFMRCPKCGKVLN
jgi:predicted nucleic acid-binding Zn ribbon protein